MGGSRYSRGRGKRLRPGQPEGRSAQEKLGEALLSSPPERGPGSAPHLKSLSLDVIFSSRLEMWYEALAMLVVPVGGASPTASTAPLRPALRGGRRRAERRPLPGCGGASSAVPRAPFPRGGGGADREKGRLARAPSGDQHHHLRLPLTREGRPRGEGAAREERGAASRSSEQRDAGEPNTPQSVASRSGLRSKFKEALASRANVAPSWLPIGVPRRRGRSFSRDAKTHATQGEWDGYSTGRRNSRPPSRSCGSENF